MGIHIMPTRSQHEPPADDYAVWHTVVDAVVARGRRSQVEKFLLRRGWIRAEINSAFTRADERGSSTSSPWVGWDTPLIVMSEGARGKLPRHLLRPYCDALFRRVFTKRSKARRLATLQALLEPFDDD